MHQTSTGLVDVLSPALIHPALHSANRDAVIRELAGLLTDSQEAVDAQDVFEALLERERQGSTAIGEEIAIPHAKLHSAETMIACLGRSLKGVDFGSADGKKVHFFFVVISPLSSSGSHLKLLAQFCQLFKSGDLRAKLMNATTAEEMYALIAAQESK